MAPLAERVRPQFLHELIGQEHLTNSSGILYTSINNNILPSLILWGPPGVGKTTIATIIANSIQANFHALSAISSGVKDVRDIIEQSKLGGKHIVFIDEIHRFNKSQQDALLGAVEKGWITLIGATTENPSFEVNKALLSRCQVYILQPLTAAHLLQLLNQAITKDAWLQQQKIVLEETAAILHISGGDARKLLNLFELVVSHTAPNNQAQKVITNKQVVAIAQQHIAQYDKTGEQHYDIASAFIKSMRGSDPNAAVYWLARMIDGGEDVQFIARRMLIFASEDIGNANPNALLLANTTFDAVSKIGYPESRIILSQCATYLACSAKSNAAYQAINAAITLAKQTGNLPVPLHIRNAPTQLMQEMGYGKNYAYSHLGNNNFIEQEYMPKGIENSVLYNPGNNAREQEQRNFLKERWLKKYGY
jgi:putative ATPase